MTHEEFYQWIVLKCVSAIGTVYTDCKPIIPFVVLLILFRILFREKISVIIKELFHEIGALITNTGSSVKKMDAALTLGLIIISLIMVFDKNIEHLINLIFKISSPPGSVEDHQDIAYLAMIFIMVPLTGLGSIILCKAADKNW